MTNCCTLYSFLLKKRIQKKNKAKNEIELILKRDAQARINYDYLFFISLLRTYLWPRKIRVADLTKKGGKKLQCFKCYDDLNSRLQRHVPALTYREFSNERTRVERRETFRKLRMKENFSKAFEGYFQWIIRAGEISNKKISNYHLNIHCLLAVYRLSSLHIYTYIYI